MVSKNTIEFYISKGFFKEGDCRPPEGEITPAPKEGEVVVFRDFFTAGLRLPADLVIPSLLAPLNVKLHHLTPNAMVKLSKFLWVVLMRTCPQRLLKLRINMFIMDQLHVAVQSYSKRGDLILS